MAADGIKRSVGFRVPEAELSCVVGIGGAFGDRLTASPRPAGLHPFRELAGPRHTAVATFGDLLCHIRAHRFDMCFELAQRLIERLRGLVEVVDEVHGFRSFDERDVLGFVHGTENPAGATAAEAVLIGEEDPVFAGGSYVNSHLALNVITGPDGEERQIMRFKMPFGRVGADEFGTYYIAYARTSELIEQMLTNDMFIGNPPDNADRLRSYEKSDIT